MADLKVILPSGATRFVTRVTSNPGDAAYSMYSTRAIEATAANIEKLQKALEHAAPGIKIKIN